MPAARRTRCATSAISADGVGHLEVGRRVADGGGLLAREPACGEVERDRLRLAHPAARGGRRGPASTSTSVCRGGWTMPLSSRPTGELERVEHRLRLARRRDTRAAGASPRGRGATASWYSIRPGNAARSASSAPDPRDHLVRRLAVGAAAPAASRRCCRRRSPRSRRPMHEQPSLGDEVAPAEQPRDLGELHRVAAGDRSRPSRPARFSATIASAVVERGLALGVGEHAAAAAEQRAVEVGVEHLDARERVECARGSR